MIQAEALQLKTYIHTLEHLMPRYNGKTIDNILTQLKARMKEYETTMDRHYD